jgi:HEAT repeat protein
MAKARSLEGKLAKLRLLRGVPLSPQVIEELRAALTDSSNQLVAEAAALVAKAQIGDLAPDLVAAYERFLDDPVENDKLCRAKIAIAEALNQMDFSEEDFFWLGARYVQLEPVWGGHKDTAAPVRVACGFALVRLRSRGVMPLLVDLLSDPEKPARIGAAQALAYSETEAAGLLLRLKARVGDPEPEVISECFAGVLKLAPGEGVPFVAEFLDSADQAVQESAILALGDSRRPEAFETLKAFWGKPAPRGLEETVLMALALLRLPAATDLLLELAAAGKQPIAAAAISALALHRYDAGLRERTAAVVKQSGRDDLRAHFEKRFRTNE